MIPKKLLNEAVLLQFKSISSYDLEMFNKGVQCAEILMKDIVIEFADYMTPLMAVDKASIAKQFEQFIKEKYGE